MKNLFKITLAIILVMSVLAFMFACGKNEAEAGDTTVADDTTTESTPDSTESGDDNTESDNVGGDDVTSDTGDKISQNDAIPGTPNEDLGYEGDFPENA